MHNRNTSLHDSVVSNDYLTKLNQGGKVSYRLVLEICIRNVTAFCTINMWSVQGSTYFYSEQAEFSSFRAIEC